MKVKWDDSKFKAEVHKATTKRLVVAAETVRGNAVRSMGSGKDGYRKYYRTKAKKEHWSSGPGDPPHVDTGRLRASLTWMISEGTEQGNAVKAPATQDDAVGRPDRESRRIVAVIGTNVKYAAALEFGTRYMAARPFLRQALEKARAKIKWLYE